METATTVSVARGDDDDLISAASASAIKDRNPLCYLSTCLSPPCSVAVVVPIHHHHNRDHDAVVGGDRYRGGSAGRSLWRRIARKVLKESKSFYTGGSGSSDAGCSCGRAAIGGGSSGGGGGGRKQSVFGYDAVSYLQNFDEGRGTAAAGAAADAGNEFMRGVDLERRIAYTRMLASYCPLNLLAIACVSVSVSVYGRNYSICEAEEEDYYPIN